MPLPKHRVMPKHRVKHHVDKAKKAKHLHTEITTSRGQVTRAAGHGKL